MPKISILVPIYNVEMYLRECLDSIVNQTLNDIEIICINDGSTDSSLQIIQEYSNKDSRIKILDKENSGYGDSMNRGLEIAQGEYIGIIESDDFAKKEMFEDLYNIASENNADIVKSDFFYYATANNQSRKAGMIQKNKVNKVLNARKYKKLLKMKPSIWSAIYRREFLLEHNINFLPTPGASYQDTAFSFKAMALANVVVLTDKSYVYYRSDNENSSVHSKKKALMICQEYKEITRFLKDNPEIKKFANTTKLIKQYSAYIWNLVRIDEKYRDDFIDEFQKEFKKYSDHNEITQDFYKKIKPDEFNMLLNDKKAFMEYIDDLIAKEKQKEKRRKRFSIRINMSRISIVMFGKQIVEIG